MSSVTRRGFLHAGAAAAAASRAQGQASRPNVLFIMADQLRHDCVGANGNRLIRTPNLDRLAAQSANFTYTFVQSPVCVPSRISFFTGRYPHSHRNRVNYTPCDRSEVFIHKLLQDAGYQTGSVGKLHFFPPTAEHARGTGFDRVLLDDGISRTDKYSDYVKWRNANDPKASIYYQSPAKDIAPGKNPFRLAIDYEYTPTAWVGANSREMLRDFAASSKPFYLFSSFFKPHAPHTVPPPYDSMFDDVNIPMPKQVTLEHIKTLPKPVQTQILRGRPEYAMDRERVQWLLRGYYAGVAMVDREVGLLLDELEKSGKAENTIVIFSSDHGDQLMEHGLAQKNLFFEGSIRIPLFVRFPKRFRAAKYSEMIETVDIVPTVLEACGLPVPGNCQGRSFAPLLTGGSYTPRETVFSENIIPEVITSGSMKFEFEAGKGVGGIRHPDSKMARTRRWKLNYYPGNGGELYDLEKDPDEFNNLFADPAHQHIVNDLKTRLLDWMITADEAEQIAPHWLI